MRARRLLYAVAIVLVTGLVLSWAVGSVIARPSNHPVDPPEPPGQVVRLVAADGVRIEGSYWPGAREDGPAVLLLHGINNDRNLFRRHREWLGSLGYAVLAIDFRGHGASRAAERTFGWRESADASAALAFLRKGSAHRKVGLIGVSLGGAAALLGRDGPLAVDAMVLHAVYPSIRTAISNRIQRAAFPALAHLAEPLLSYQSYLRYGVGPERIAPIEGARRYRAPLLVIGGTRDRETRVEDTRALFEAAGSRAKALWLVEGADHVETSKLWSDEYRRQVRCLFARTLTEPRSPTGGGPPCRSPAI